MNDSMTIKVTMNRLDGETEIVILKNTFQEVFNLMVALYNRAIDQEDSLSGDAYASLMWEVCKLSDVTLCQLAFCLLMRGMTPL